MKQVTLIQNISDLLLQFSNEVKAKGKHKLTDINIISEDVLVPILSIVYETELINLNDTKANYPGIDIATNENLTVNSETKRIAFQITSTNNVEKIKKTIKTYISSQNYLKFDELFVYNLIEKQESYHKKTQIEIETLINGHFKFDLEKNILDRHDLLKIIKTLTPIEKIEKIEKILKDQFVYNKRSLLSLEIWQSDGKVGYGFSNLINSIDATTYKAFLHQFSGESKDILQFIFSKINRDFTTNYENNEGNKFINLAFNTYLKAAFEQATISYNFVYSDIENSISAQKLQESLSNSFKNIEEKIDESDYPLVNQPTDHPAVKFIKLTSMNILKSANLESDLINKYIKDFNQNIENSIIRVFGEDDYLVHKEQTKGKWIRENEKELLNTIKNLPNLSFIEGEQLEYEATFGMWQDVRLFGKETEEQFNFDPKDKNTIEDTDEKENKLEKVEILIEKYFEQYKNQEEGYLNNILFLIADFGKGKSSFLHYFSSKLAKQYLKSHDGLFPIYLNLSDYHKYTNSPSLGIIGNFLAKRFKIDIREDYFKKKNYCFLIDSLDESGEITETHIEKVVKEIIEIQNLDNINRRDNRIIIASRPIDKGLKEQISKHRPYLIEMGNNKKSLNNKIENYIAIYGFKKDQFNNYINYAVKKYWSSEIPDINKLTGFTKDVYNKLERNEIVDFYSELHEKVLKGSELRRPIFGYMLYKLIISNLNFLDFGKVGVYISFLNQLSKEAKHKDDITYKVSLKEEFIYRNILHASALLWQYRRQNGEQTSLTKADICRTIEEDEIDKSEKKVLIEFPDVNSIHFLSHSYLGEADNTLHFQHQSFAEILLAEYYLKVLIKCAIEENTGFEEARIRLSVGLPTDQTIDFFKGLLKLLRESALGNPSEKHIYSKRELFIPLLSSMSLTTHNKKLYSTRLSATWFEKYEESIYSNNKIDTRMIEDFPITDKVLTKIEILAQRIIESPKMFILDDAQTHNVLYKKELLNINNLKDSYFEVDKWLALITGNYIGNDSMNRKFFNSKINSTHIFKLIEDVNYYSNNVPEWGYELFRGINMNNNDTGFSYRYLVAYKLDFSYSHFKDVNFYNSNFNSCNFSNVIFENTNLDSCKIYHTCMDEIDIRGDFSLTLAQIAQGIFFPYSLVLRLKTELARKGEKDPKVHHGLVNHGPQFSTIGNYHFDISDYHQIRGLFKYLFKIGISLNFVMSTFKFEEDYINKVKKSKKLDKESIKIQFKHYLAQIEQELNS